MNQADETEKHNFHIHRYSRLVLFVIFTVVWLSCTLLIGYSGLKEFVRIFNVNTILEKLMTVILVLVIIALGIYGIVSVIADICLFSRYTNKRRKRIDVVREPVDKVEQQIQCRIWNCKTVYTSGNNTVGADNIVYDLADGEMFVEKWVEECKNKRTEFVELHLPKSAKYNNIDAAIKVYKPNENVKYKLKIKK